MLSLGPIYDIISSEPAYCKLDIGTTFSAMFHASFVGRRFQTEDSEGPSFATSGDGGMQPVGRHEANWLRPFNAVGLFFVSQL